MLISPALIETNAGVRERIRREKAAGKTIGFVPTMGALHDGHAELLRIARRQTDFVVASVFVNPLQFDRPDDLARYPRTLEADLRICADCGTDAVYFPAPQEIYPQEQMVFVELPKLSENLCGRFRPGHFRGVATVVLKLFNIVQADRAYFGEKDGQQLAIIRRLTTDLNVPIEIVGVPTVREPDGLALSSRNKHLSPAERIQAVALSQMLEKTAKALQEGADAATACAQALKLLETQPGVRLEYLEIVDPDTLAPLTHPKGRIMIAGAIWVGTTRLIDNFMPVVR